MNDTGNQTTITLSISDEDGQENKHVLEIEAITPANDNEEFWALLDDSDMPRLILTSEEFGEIYGTFDHHNET